MADYPFLKTYRTFNKWADQALIIDATKGAVPYELAGLEEYLDDPWLSGLKYRFFATPGNHEYQKLYRQIPMKNIISYAETLMEPVYGDYTEVTENEEFLKVANRFYFE